MSAPWQCWLCQGYDSERPNDRQCRCVTVRHEDWLLLRSLWKNVRRIETTVGSIETNVAVRERLDALFFAGEECQTFETLLPGPIVLGGDSCT